MNKGYTEKQDESGIKIGDRVKVLRAARSFTKGWDNCWMPEMSRSIGGVFRVTEIRPMTGIALNDNSDCEFPYFILEKVKRKKGGRVK